MLSASRERASWIRESWRPTPSSCTPTPGRPTAASTSPTSGSPPAWSRSSAASVGVSSARSSWPTGVTASGRPIRRSWRRWNRTTSGRCARRSPAPSPGPRTKRSCAWSWMRTGSGLGPATHATWPCARTRRSRRRPTSTPTAGPRRSRTSPRRPPTAAAAMRARSSCARSRRLSPPATTSSSSPPTTRTGRRSSTAASASRPSGAPSRSCGRPARLRRPSALADLAQRPAERLASREHALEEIALALHSPEHDLRREVERVEVLRHLFPAERRRDRRARPRTDGVRGGDRLPLAVLVRVDEDAAAFRLRPLRRDETAMEARQRPGDDLGELARFVVGVPPLDRHEDVKAVGPARLRAPDEAEGVEDLLDEQCHAHHLAEADVRRRVEVEEHPIGPLGPVDPRVPRVHVDAAHVHHPEEPQLVVHERIADRPLLP